MSKWTRAVSWTRGVAVAWKESRWPCGGGSSVTHPGYHSTGVPPSRPAQKRASTQGSGPSSTTSEIHPMAGSLIRLARGEGGAAGKFGFARGAHAGQRGGLVAGHQLDLAGSLVQEQVEATDDDGTGFGGDLGEGGGPGGVHHVEHGRGTGAGIPGPFGVKVGGTGRHGGNEQATVPDLGAERPQVHLHAQPARGSQQVAGP